nr:MAG TPA: hypothetical protein [Caudoviricetes sp.]
MYFLAQNACIFYNKKIVVFKIAKKLKCVL